MTAGDTSTAEPLSVPGGIRAVVFDVIGTVVDDGTTTERLTLELFTAAGLDAAAAARTIASWSSRLDEAIDAICRGDQPWEASDALRRQALLYALADLSEHDRGLLGSERTEELALVGHRFAPWADSPAALDLLAGHFTLVALTNGELAQTVDMAAAGGLRWHCVFTSEMARAYKPDPAMYQLPLRRLGLRAERTLFVAAHPWDLRAAAEHGYRTGYIGRPGADPAGDGEFDLAAEDLLSLAEALTPVEPQ